MAFLLIYAIYACGFFPPTACLPRIFVGAWVWWWLSEALRCAIGIGIYFKGLEGIPNLREQWMNRRDSDSNHIHQLSMFDSLVFRPQLPSESVSNQNETNFWVLTQSWCKELHHKLPIEDPMRIPNGSTSPNNIDSSIHLQILHPPQVHKQKQFFCIIKIFPQNLRYQNIYIYYTYIMCVYIYIQ